MYLCIIFISVSIWSIIIHGNNSKTYDNLCCSFTIFSKTCLIKSMECNFKSVSYDKYHDLIVHWSLSHFKVLSWTDISNCSLQNISMREHQKDIMMKSASMYQEMISIIYCCSCTQHPVLNTWWWSFNKRSFLPPMTVA